jgi:hypothetical protein
VAAVLFGAVAIYAIPSMTPGLIWADWITIPPLNYVRLVAAVLMTTFLPGYFLLRVLDRKRQFKALEIIVFSYLLSLVLVPLTSVLDSVLGFTLLENGIPLIIGLNLFLCLVCSISATARYRGSTFRRISVKTPIPPIIRLSGVDGRERLYWSVTVLGVIGLGLALWYRLLFYPPYLIGDQWPHHASALLYERFGNRILASGQLPYYYFYPQWFHIYLASLFAVSGVPSTNTYFSVNFTNIFGLLALYLLARSYFGRRRGLATSTMALALFSGFGWAYDLWLRVTGAYTGDLLMQLYHASISTFDIAFPNTYFGSAHPDLTSELQVMALPALLMLLTLTNRNDLKNTTRYVLISLLVALAFLAHVAEGGVFAAILLVSVIVSRRMAQQATGIGIATFLGMMLAGAVGLILSYGFYLSLGVFYVALTLPLATIVLALVRRKLPKESGMFSVRLRRVTVAFLISTVGLVVWLGLFLLWRLSGYNAFNIWWDYYPFMGLTVPPYMYPSRFGIIGLLAIPALASALFVWRGKTRGLSLITGFVAVSFAVGRLWMFHQLSELTYGGFLEEFRWNKYLALALTLPIGLFLWRRLTRLASGTLPMRRILGGFLLGIILFSGLASTFLYGEFTTLAYTTATIPNPVAPAASPALALINSHQLSPEELAAIQYVRNHLHSDEAVGVIGTLIWGPGSFGYAKLAFVGGLLQNQTFSLGTLYAENNSSQIVLKLRDARVRYVYLTQDDLDVLQHHVELFKTIIVFPVAFKNSEVTIYTLTT